MSDAELNILRQYYEVEDSGLEWRLRCKRCTSEWGLLKNAEGIGNILYLLNHAKSHKANC